MLTLTGADLWLIGQVERGRRWPGAASTGGATWAEALRVRPKPGPTPLVRFYFAGGPPGSSTSRPRTRACPVVDGSLAFDGTTWTDGPDPLPVPTAIGWRAEPFAGRMVYRAQPPYRADGRPRSLAFDGQQVEPSPLARRRYRRPRPCDGAQLFALTTRGPPCCGRRTSRPETPSRHRRPGSRSIGAVARAASTSGPRTPPLHRLRRAARAIDGRQSDRVQCTPVKLVIHPPVDDERLRRIREAAGSMAVVNAA